MTSEEMISQLKKIVNNDSEYLERIEKLPWIEVFEESISISLPYKLTEASILHFPKGYVVKENFLDVYARCVLSNMAQWEEWDKNFWKEENLLKEILLGEVRSVSYTYDLEKGLARKAILEAGKSSEFYADYNRIENPKLKAVSDEEMILVLDSFSDTLCRKDEYCKELTEEERELFISAVKGSQAVLIGENKYWSPNLIAVKEDTVIFLTCSNYD